MHRWRVHPVREVRAPLLWELVERDGRGMILAADYPFLDILWTMLIFFLWVMWFWCLIIIIGDVFSRRDIGGWSKALWTTMLIFLPVLGMLIYLIAHGSDMADRRVQGAQQQRAAIDDHIR